MPQKHFDNTLRRAIFGLLAVALIVLPTGAECVNKLAESSFQTRTKNPDPLAEVSRLWSLAHLEVKENRYAEAEQRYKRILEILEKQPDEEHPEIAIVRAIFLDQLADLYKKQIRYAEAEEIYKRVLEISEKYQDVEHIRLDGYFMTLERPNVASSRHKLALLYKAQDRYADAELLYKRALEIDEKTLGAEDPDVTASLNNLAGVYRDQARYAEAEPLYKRALAILEKELGEEHLDVAASLNNLAGVYRDQARYAEAEPLYMRSLAIREKVLGAKHPYVAVSLNNLAGLYCDWDRYAEAEPLYKRALAIREKQPRYIRRILVPLSLRDMAALYKKQGRYTDAEQFYKRTLAMMEDAGAAISIYGNVLAIWEEVEHPNVGIALNDLAWLYLAWEKRTEAEPLFERALAIAAASEDTVRLWSVHGNLRDFYGESDPSLAIFYGKQVVNILQGVREANITMDAVAQQSFLKKRAVHYNKLADLLFSQNRLAEGQQVLAMLKEAEYHEFTGKNATADDDPRRSRVAYSPWEVKWERRFDRLIKKTWVAKKLAIEDPETTAYAEFKRQWLQLSDDEGVEDQENSEEWNRRFELLTKKLVLARKLTSEASSYAEIKKRMRMSSTPGGEYPVSPNEFAAFFEDVKRAFAEGASGEANRLDNTSPMQKPLGELGEGTVLVQYLMPQERLWILVTTKDGMKAQQVDIKADALTQKINAFKDAIVAKSPDVNTLGKELHALLIAPAAEDLQGANTLMLAPDGALRYLPFAALHDGEQYLAQRYVLSNYTDMSKDRITDKPTANWSFAGFGVSKKVSDLHALPAVAGELAGIRANALDGTVRLDGDFTRESLQQALNSPPPVVHVASHFVFEKRGNEQASYLLLGDGGKLTLADIRKGYRFNGVDLVALSACNTGVGGEDKDGREVEGLGVLVQRQGAKGVLASLWEVADESTGQFMQLFYSLRQRQGLSKAEALRQAQLAFIEGRVAAELTEAARARGRQTDAAGKTVEAAGANHPYYWAPFILMGNWL